MARLVTAGAELQGFDSIGGAAGITGVAVPSGAGNTLTLDTTVKRSGAASYKCAVGGTTGGSEIQFPFTTTQGISSFCRGYINVPSSVGWPSSVATVCRVQAFAILAEVRVSSTGVATLWASNVQVGTGSYQLALDTWHRIEAKALVPAAGNGTLALQIDGAVVVADTSVNIGTSTTIAVRWGAFGANSATITNFTVYVDDVAVNDSNGASQNSYPGAGSVVLLTPASDNAVAAGWTTDLTTQTNRSLAVKNTPPVGIADTTAGSGLHQIRDAVSSATDNYDANLQTYSAAGIPAGSTVTLVQAVASVSAASATSPPNMALFLVSNAGGTTEGSETSLTTTGAAGTWTTGWASKLNTTLVIAAQPTLTSAPVLRIGKRTSSNRVAMCCFMGLTVEYVPPPLLAAQSRGRHFAARSPSPSRGRF